MRPPVLLLLALLFGAVTAGAQGVAAENTAGAATNLTGWTISAVEYDPPSQPLPRAELDRLLPLHPGAELRAEDVRTALQKMYATGRYEDVSIDGEPAGDGVSLRITTSLRYFVSGVSVDGANSPPNRNQLLTATKLDLGAPFAASDIPQAIQNIQERLRANGLYRATVQSQLERSPSTEEISIHFDIDAGKRARFDGVKLTGAFQKSPESVIRSADWRRGFGPIIFPGWRELTETRVQQGIEKVRQSFQGVDRLQASVTLQQLAYHEATNTVTPALLIDSGPVIQVRASGAKVSNGRLRQLIPVFEERSVDRSLLVEGSRNLVDYFQSQGYFDVKVDFTENSETSGVDVINYSIDRSVRHKLVNIEVAGNHFFDTATIRERLTISEASLLRFRYGRYSPRLRDQDRDAIRDLYRSNGFRDVIVTATTLDDYLGRHNQLAVRFQIEEGPQWFIRQLEITGVADSDATALRGMIQASEGQAFSEANVAADRDMILSYFLNGGYPGVTFDWIQTPAAEPNRVNVRYVIQPGDRLFVRDILIRGLKTTRPRLVSGLIRLHPGDPLSQSQISESQQRLYNLGIFSKVQNALQNPNGQEESKRVIFQLDEANRYSFTAAVGAELARIGGGVTTFDAPAGTTGFSPRVSVGISRLNFLGLAQTLSFQSLVSTLEQRAVTTYNIPRFTGNENLTLTVSGLFDYSRDVRTFAARRWEGSVQLAQHLSRANSMQYRFSYRRSTIDQNTLKISPELIPLLSQPVRVGAYSMSFVQDRRDNPTDTRRGIYNTVDAGIALPQFGSETDYTRLLLRNATYHPLGKNLVLARTLQLGYMQRLGGVPEIPLAERFFAGGSSTNRAFPDNQAGPRDLETGFPLGGTALLFHATELRFPLFGNNIGGVLFHDMGNVYTDITEISFRFRQRNIQDFNYMVQAVGFGIRYRTPVGPIRVDLSFSPDSPRFHGFQGTRDQLLANQGTLTDQRINQFQFHFSLGQTF